MVPFDDLQPSASPKTIIRGLNPDPAIVNDVYIRCTTAPEAVLHLTYRCLPPAKPGFPRVANLWGSWHFVPKGMVYASRIDLWLGAHFTADQIRELRRLNPNCLILTSINTVENNDVPDEYFLRDTTGQKIEVWPGAYRLNLTRPEVAEYQARYAYQKMIESELMYDGCVFDNFMMSQHWLTHDIHDRPVQLDADGDGQQDDKEAFDKAWRDGVFRELQEWRKLMPWALTSGHSQGYPYPEIAEIFNGQGIGFYTTDVIEGKKSFYELWDYYNAWCTVTVKPAITSVESAVPDQIAYGYDYSPQKNTPAATWDFARDYYPYMRFGLAFTLMSDGYFSHELGDTDHGQDWWYDELDYKLGTPLGPAHSVAVGPTADVELIQDGGFERELAGTWSLWCDTKNGCAATVARDTRFQLNGTAAARITITGAGRQGGIEFTQSQRSLEQGKSYRLTFWARANSPMELLAISSKGSPDWDNYGLSQTVRLRVIVSEHQCDRLLDSPVRCDEQRCPIRGREPTNPMSGIGKFNRAWNGSPGCHRYLHGVCYGYSVTDASLHWCRHSLRGHDVNYAVDECGLKIRRCSDSPQGQGVSDDTHVPVGTAVHAKPRQKRTHRGLGLLPSLGFCCYFIKLKYIHSSSPYAAIASFTSRKNWISSPPKSLSAFVQPPWRVKTGISSKSSRSMDRFCTRWARMRSSQDCWAVVKVLPAVSLSKARATRSCAVNKGSWSRAACLTMLMMSTRALR